MNDISSIEGIGNSYALKFKEAGIRTVENLLDAASDKRAREKLAEATGISEKLVLKWANMADLFRINGVAGQHAELLECSGVDTVKELAQRNAESLRLKMTAVNARKNVVRNVPPLRFVNGWIAEAKTLPRKVSY